ncbi:Hypothetical predicted protein [Lecanosticta acicola]|uniref:Rhodopsin domain-containing protein n=1 Tax=Lecanosticta acicola TaxID=111012 RepID=A0AAI8Z873_9PEZI|nr:Hypothetical predicted protein [Lecanosticta acicola]
MAILQAFVARDVLLAFCILGIVATTLITLLRVYVRITRQNRLREDDFALFVAVALYITMAALYIADLPYLYTVMDWLEGTTPTVDLRFIAASYTQMMKFNWAVTLFYWAVLWSVKLSLLLFFRRVISQIKRWMRAWWCILAFTLVSFCGCVVSQITSCDTPHDFTVLGKCAAPRNARAQITSLYYSYAADVLTDLLSMNRQEDGVRKCLLTVLAVMALPLRIVAALRLATRDRWILAGLFGVTSIAIVVSTIRVFLIYAKTGNGSPSPPWLGLWAVIEGMVAIIVGCIPVISQIFRTSREISSSASRGAAQPMKDFGGSDMHTASTSAGTTVECGPSPDKSRRVSTNDHHLGDDPPRYVRETEIVGSWSNSGRL